MGQDARRVDLQGLRVFVSYPRGGHAHSWAEQVQADLQARGAEAWRDELQIHEGDASWYERIRDALRAADAVVCIVDGHSEHCRWQQREALKADQVALPIVAFRTEAIALPFYLAEQQPVELRDAPQGRQSLQTLAEALARRRVQALAAPVPATGAAAPDAAARRRETEWLQGLLHGEFSDREDRYVELAADLRQARGAERSLKGLRMPSSLVLQAFGLQAGPEDAQPAEHLDDVLDAMRRLSARPAAVRRLAVLGDPGAGKSFSLERIAFEAARRALRDPAAPRPLLVRLGGWTREEPLQTFIEAQLTPLARDDFVRLRDAGRAMLLLDGVNEIPPGQRKAKAAQIRQMAEDTRFAAVVVSCRERDFDADFDFPFDRVTLQPLSPLQIHGFLRRAFGVGALDGAAAVERAEACFWQIAGDELEQAWGEWREKGESIERFLTLPEVPEKPVGERIYDWRSRRLLADPRGLLKLAANPFLLTLMMQLVQEVGEIPSNRARLIAGFLSLLHTRETEARQRRHDAASVPDPARWRAALVTLSEAMQRLDGAAGDDGARTSMPAGDLPAGFDDAMLAFSIDASVLQRQGSELRFTHQLLQESLAADVLLDAAHSGSRPVHDFWPRARWWQRSGWEVVAEIAAEACEGDAPGQLALLRWLAEAQPDVAVDVWQHAGRPPLPAAFLAETKAQWLPRMTDVQAEPAAQARHAIGRWLGALDLDDRPGTGLRADGLPDIEWVRIDDPRPFVYQYGTHPALPAYAIARYPVTNRQWQAFVDEGGYTDERWWVGLAERPEPEAPRWNEPTAPRETVSWYEAIAYCRWLGHRLECELTLPTEQQWERAARGVEGREWPWHAEWDDERASAQYKLGRTSLVGLFPNGATPPERAGVAGIHDLAGNVWEWCLNEYDDPAGTAPEGVARRVGRGGWRGPSGVCRPSYRFRFSPGNRNDGLGFRLVSSCPIPKP
ncbi:MAG: SUMF1/EgtB/PvdO family nonheme iron enzyme [Burkholderiaceae bacterium]|nr:SUMF1/EgtB/PvdO family nonheme iron enzyme [Burkholderiaceae bacterium]